MLRKEEEHYLRELQTYLYNYDIKNIKNFFNPLKINKSLMEKYLKSNLPASQKPILDTAKILREKSENEQKLPTKRYFRELLNPLIPNEFYAQATASPENVKTIYAAIPDVILIFFFDSLICLFGLVLFVFFVFFFFKWISPYRLFFLSGRHNLRRIF